MRNESKFNDVEAGYKNASFWYPSIQLGFQVLFLAPLIIIALLVNQYAQSRGYGLIALISWHLLVMVLPNLYCGKFLKLPLCPAMLWS